MEWQPILHVCVNPLMLQVLLFNPSTFFNRRLLKRPPSLFSLNVCVCLCVSLLYRLCFLQPE